MNPDRVFMITDRNVLAPNGERQLVYDRAKSLWANHGISTRILVVRPDIPGKAALPPGETLPGINVVSRTYRSPFGLRTAVSEEISQTGMSRGDTVIVSGTIVLLLVGMLKKRGLRVIVDIHADPHEWLEHPPRVFGAPAAIGRVLAPIVVSVTKRAVRQSHGSFVVSGHLESFADRAGDGEIFRVPCFTQEWPSPEDCERARAAVRSRLGIAADQVVWAYSGGLSGWQMIDEVIAAFAIIAREDTDSRFLFLTPRPDEIRERCASAGLSEDVVISRSVQPDEVVPHLCAADIGMLLRESNLTNAAAFPNKFSEYVAAGLYVIVGKGALDPAMYVDRFALGEAVEPQEFLATIARRTPEILDATRHGREGRLDRRADFHKELSMDATLSPFAAYVRSDA